MQVTREKVKLTDGTVMGYRGYVCPFAGYQCRITISKRRAFDQDFNEWRSASISWPAKNRASLEDSVQFSAALIRATQIAAEFDEEVEKEEDCQRLKDSMEKLRATLSKEVDRRDDS